MAIEPKEYGSEEGRTYSHVAKDWSVEDTEAMSHPSAPWFRWSAKSRQPEFYIWYQNKVVSCKYLCYKMEGGITYKFETEGKDQQQFQ